MKQVFEALSGSEQLQLMSRLGYYLVWATLARPEGLHFKCVFDCSAAHNSMHMVASQQLRGQIEGLHFKCILNCITPYDTA